MIVCEMMIMIEMYETWPSLYWGMQNRNTFYVLIELTKDPVSFSEKDPICKSSKMVFLKLVWKYLRIWYLSWNVSRPPLNFFCFTFWLSLLYDLSTWLKHEVDDVILRYDSMWDDDNVWNVWDLTQFVLRSAK